MREPSWSGCTSQRSWRRLAGSQVNQLLPLYWLYRSYTYRACGGCVSLCLAILTLDVISHVSPRFVATSASEYGILLNSVCRYACLQVFGYDMLLHVTTKPMMSQSLNRLRPEASGCKGILMLHASDEAHSCICLPCLCQEGHMIVGRLVVLAAIFLVIWALHVFSWRADGLDCKVDMSYEAIWSH